MGLSPVLSRANFEGRARGAILLDSSEADAVLQAVGQIGGIRLVLSSEVRAGVPPKLSGKPTRPPLKKRSSSTNNPAGRPKKNRPMPLEVQATGEADASPPKASTADAPTTAVRELGPELGLIPVEQLEVREVDSNHEQEEAVSLHLSKNTFHEEREFVKLRVYRGHTCGCRTWALVCRSDIVNSAGALPLAEPGLSPAAKAKAKANAKDVPVVFLAAATLRLNAYRNYEGCWAQILNMSTRRERHGLGTHLIAGLQELLRKETVNAVVLYPALNGRAPAFWSSVGFSLREVSVLPVEERTKSGPLLPEFDFASGEALPRWEKRILGSSLVASLKKQHPTRRAAGRRPSSGFPFFRMVSAVSSRLGGEKLRLASEGLVAQRALWKASLCKASAPQSWAGVPELEVKRGLVTCD